MINVVKMVATHRLKGQYNYFLGVLVSLSRIIMCASKCFHLDVLAGGPGFAGELNFPVPRPFTFLCKDAGFRSILT
jgi:hypothetical protein